MSFVFDDIYMRRPASRSVRESYEDLGFDSDSTMEEDLFYVDSIGEGVDPIEYITGVIYECDINMRELELEILGEEYMYLRESGYEMPISEAGGAVNRFVDKAEEYVQKAWDKMQKFFKEIVKKVDETLRLDSRFLSQYKTKAIKKSTKYKAPEDFSESISKGADIIALFDIAAEKTFEAIVAVSKELSDKFKEDPTDEEDSDDMYNVEWVKSELEKKIPTDKNKIEFFPAINDIAQMKSDTADSLSDANSNRKLVVVNGKWAVEQFEKSKTVKKTIKKSYDKSKKAIVEQLRGLKKLRRAQKTGGVFNNETSKLAHNAVKSQKYLLKALSVSQRCLVKQINAIRKELKKCIVSCAAKDKLGGDVEEKKDGSESEPKK